jgi:hypothetical protein
MDPGDLLGDEVHSRGFDPFQRPAAAGVTIGRMERDARYEAKTRSLAQRREQVCGSCFKTSDIGIMIVSRV